MRGGSVTYRHLSIVIGEGASTRKGFLRFVLEGEGFEVAVEASTVEELSRVFAVHHPDIVVLDDSLGTAGLELTQRLAPDAKIVVVWPAAVQPIGANARVEPGSVVRELGSTVERVAGIGPVTGLIETFERPDWIGKVRKDPATLREILAAGRTRPSSPSVTELQRSSRQHPNEDLPAAQEVIAVPEVIEVPEAVEAVETVVVVVSTEPPVEDPDDAWNRKLRGPQGSSNANGHDENRPVHHHKA